MAYQPGIFQYGTIGADGGFGYDDYGFHTDEIFTLPPFKVNENTNTDGTINNTFGNLDLQNLYNAGLTGGNIFTGGGTGGGTAVFQTPTDDGGYKDPVNIADYKKGLIGPEGYGSGRSEPKLINPPGPIVLPPVEVPIGPMGGVGAGGYTDAVNQDLFNRGLIGPAGYNSGSGPSVGPINPPGPIVLPPVEVPIGSNPITSSSLTYSGPSSGFQGPIANPSGPIQLPSVQVPIGPTSLTYSGPSSIFQGPIQNTEGPIVLPKVEVPIGPTSLTYSGPPSVFQGPIQNTEGPVTLHPVIVTPGATVGITVPSVSLPPVTVSNFSPNVTYPPITSSQATTTAAPVNTVSITQVPFDPTTVNTGVGGYTTNTQSLTTKRDFGKELEESLAALKKNQAGIMGMYGDLYKQFMPKGITDTESSIIDQYKTDLVRLQQRQAGVLAPEDIRQSQQAAREAYGARGQVMGRGAIGAEIMGRENIRQQREDQARAGMQASYGNIMNMANLQTGNIFSPIGNLMSNTFNPLSPYAGDVYGTNVNAQLAKEIAQKNYDAAVRSAELSGAATKSASNTSLFGDLLKVGGSVKIALACMPGYQCIDTPNGPVPIQDLRGGDYVIGYDNTVKRIEQLCSYVENPETEFLEFTLADGGKITVCGPHKILDIPAREWLVGAEMNGVPIVSIGKVTGVTTSYDLLTDVGGYRIAGVPVNSMIPEMIVQTIKQVLLNHA